jgi:hypothetical protein
MNFWMRVKLAYQAYRYPAYSSTTFLNLSRLAEEWESIAQPQFDSDRGYTLRACAADIKHVLGIASFEKRTASNKTFKSISAGR